MFVGAFFCDLSSPSPVARYKAFWILGFQGPKCFNFQKKLGLVPPEKPFAEPTYAQRANPKNKNNERNNNNA